MTSTRTSLSAVRSRRNVLLAGAGLAGLLLAGCGSSNALSSSAAPGGAGSSSGSGSAANKTLTVGGANFTEMSVVEQLYGQLLAKNGYTITYKQVDNREIYEPALEKGDIDVVPDYAATLANFISKKSGGNGDIATADAAATVQAMQPLLAKVGITALTPSPAKDANAFAVTKEYAQANNLKTLSDLGKLGKPVTLAATTECPDRPFCQPGLEKTYGLKIAKVLPLGFGSPQAKKAVTSGQAQLVLTGTTDATLDQLGLVVLQDDKGLQLADNIVPIVSKDANTPEVKALLDKLSAALTTEDLTALNAKVDAERQTPEQVAKDYLASKGL
ncbi:MAG TPA: ABC transporter substrate-binding protein [Kineosporiaceae bacterium]|jgi:osmoprotectant transport system substrate-binding protein|nr:ABC transporter substrate-binding protein [Kineosporiaceae bacterium]